MTIGKVIRKYRKHANLTQEEMAVRLGVTAPAVNKWENENSCPDITLLAPIARLLNISLDTLLSFQEDLTEQEIIDFVDQAAQKLPEKYPAHQGLLQSSKTVVHSLDIAPAPASSTEKLLHKIFLSLSEQPDQQNL